MISFSWLVVLDESVYVEDKDGEQKASSDEFTGCCVRYLFLNKGEYEHDIDPLLIDISCYTNNANHERGTRECWGVTERQGS
jgi:hypothetical protein